MFLETVISFKHLQHSRYWLLTIDLRQHSLFLFVPQDLGHSMDSHFSSSSPMPIDVPLGDMGDGVLGHNQLTTIDHSELSAQLGLGLGGGVMLSRSKSPDQPLSATPSPAGSLQDEDMDDFRQVSKDEDQFNML